MNKSTLKFLSKLSIIILFIIGLIELALALWTILDNRYRSLAYNLADVGYIDLWILRYLSLCLFASSIITLVMCLILIWGLYSAHVFLFIASTMLVFILIGEFTISIITFKNKFETRLTLIEQLPKLVITYRQGNDERAKRALDIIQSTFRCCGADGRLSYQNNVPSSCNMFGVGCLTPTMFFLDSFMDTLAYILLFFSLIKLFIVLFFYSFLCLYQKYREKHLKTNHSLSNDSSPRHHSSSFDSSSSPDNLQKNILMSSIITDQDENDNEKQRIRIIEYEPSSSSSLLNNNGLTSSYEEHASRKLSSISEKTEKTETDDSETDVSHLKFYIPKRKAIITPVHQKHHSSKKLPIIKTRRKVIIQDDDHDSGVEHSSSSEKSLNSHYIQKTASNNSTKKSKTRSSLSFSKVFITSVSENPIIDDNEIKKSLATSSSSSISDPLLSNNIILPKPILKKSSNQKFLSDRILPKPIPRSTLKRSYQDESLV